MEHFLSERDDIIPEAPVLRTGVICVSAVPFGTAYFFMTEGSMDTRVAVISIIVEDDSSTAKLNALLSDFSDYVIGRMGVPYKERGVRLISVAVDAPQDSIAALSGKIGSLPGVSVKTAYASI